jgi:hypothetical protein
MLADEPRDVFLRYSWALEMAKEGDLATSLEALKELTDVDPPYVPAFFMAAQQLVEQRDLGSARAMLRRGIEAARAQNDAHAASEMSEFLASLGAEGP